MKLNFVIIIILSSSYVHTEPGTVLGIVGAKNRLGYRNSWAAGKGCAGRTLPNPGTSIDTLSCSAQQYGSSGGAQ